MKNIKPVRLVLKKSLSGPYDRLLRRPGPEVLALGMGENTAILRGTRLREALPLWGAYAACYYGKGGDGWSPEDFIDPQRARAWEQGDTVEYLAVPMGYFKLPNEDWVSDLAAELTPWNSIVVEKWRQGIEKALWLTVLRVYRFRPSKPKIHSHAGINIKSKPFQVKNLVPVISDVEFRNRLADIQTAVERYARSLVVSGESLVEMASDTYDLAALAKETGYNRSQLVKWTQALVDKKQIIINGPPGTGKTYLAERLARYCAAAGSGCSDLVQFHASYAYEDFVQGIRPMVTGGVLQYELAEGHFLQFCRRARMMDPAPCILVIDEINRAHLARVFGELMYLLEHRERKITLAAGGPPFAIPANVHIIGTMNTADRSIAILDQAMLRRFRFIRLNPNYDILTAHLHEQDLEKSGLIELIQNLNRVIGDADCAVGISFFLVVDLGAKLVDIWQGEIEPYLAEVFYDRPHEQENWRWSVVSEKLKIAGRK